jgi:hypothetical protein
VPHYLCLEGDAAGGCQEATPFIAGPCSKQCVLGAH